MHGVLRHYTLDAKNVARSFVGLPRVFHHQGHSGFVAYAITDAGHGQLVTYGVYESKSGAEESTRKAAAWVRRTSPRCSRTAARAGGRGSTA